MAYPNYLWVRFRIVTAVVQEIRMARRCGGRAVRILPSGGVMVLSSLANGRPRLGLWNSASGMARRLLSRLHVAGRVPSWAAAAQFHCSRCHRPLASHQLLGSEVCLQAILDTLETRRADSPVLQVTHTS
jgi:mono/diheme cytochrome c family protein